MKNQALFSSKDESKKLKCCLLQFLSGALRVDFCKRECKKKKKKNEKIQIAGSEQILYRNKSKYRFAVLRPQTCLVCVCIFTHGVKRFLLWFSIIV